MKAWGLIIGSHLKNWTYTLIILVIVTLPNGLFAEPTKAHRQNALLSPGLNLNYYYEVASVKPPTRFELQQIKEQGFRSVRIPINWMNHVDGKYIKPAFLNALKKTVQDCFDMELRVIINVHHFKEMKQEPDLYEPFLAALWRIIAHEFSGFDDRLLFELFNLSLIHI